jgi:hypothetical protein
MAIPPPDAQWYLPTLVTVLADGHWMSGFEFAATCGANVHVITAWNPGDERPSPQVNDSNNELLRADIGAIGLEVFEALGSDPNSSHAEKSWAVVGLSDAVAIELGKKYGQVAVFRITPATQSVLGCFSEWEVSRRAEDSGRAAVLLRARSLQGNRVVMSHQVTWNPEIWKSHFLEPFETQISKFADSCRPNGNKKFISRGEVVSLSDSVEDIFIGSMIFGYGPSGLGPTRVGRVIENNKKVLIKRLHVQYAEAARGPSESWISHTKTDRLIYLGPAFATKFAYFAARKQEATGLIPLIADINTSWAMWWLAGIPRSIESHDNYMKYVNLAHAWGEDLKCDFGADEIERAIFELGKGMPKKINR